MPTKYYKNAPIAEAIINIHFRQIDTFDCTKIRALGDVFAEHFPVVAPIHMVHLSVGDLGAGKVDTIPSHAAMEVGVRLTNDKSDRVLQIQQGSFALSHMAPYSSWGNFRAEAKSLWEKFVASYCDIEVTGCSVRFVNKVVIPHPSIELSDYFHLYPKIPEGIPQDVNGMLLQLQMPQADIGAVAVINLALAQPELPNHMTVVLDIDLVVGQADAIPSGSPDIWTALDRARNRKNDLFESFITDETRKLIL
jgi:uncharacterized protein (TIGR04255 family)